MNLRITKTGPRDMLEVNTMDVPIVYLQHQAGHLYLACQQWDKLYVELSEEIPEGTLKHIGSMAKTVEVSIPSPVTRKIMCLLAELYPDRAGTIRKAFASGKRGGDDYYGLLS